MQLLDMYELYIKDVEGSELVKTDFGFAIYKFLPDYICYITEIFVHPDHRGVDKAKQLGDMVLNIAKKRGCKWLYGSVAFGAKQTERSIRMLLDYDMKLQSSDGKLIYFAKEIN